MRRMASACTPFFTDDFADIALGDTEFQYATVRPLNLCATDLFR